MTEFFLTIVNMSISASWIVLAVLLLRLLLKKAPKWITVLLWGIVGLRLIMPFSFESIFSLIPSSETISKAPDSPRPHFESGVTMIDNQVNDYLGEHYFEGVTRPAGHFADITTVLAILWIAGIVLLLTYTVISYSRVKNKIGTAVVLRDNIYQSESVVSPFVLGIIKPKIYLPFKMNEQDMQHVIAHEQAHIRRKDHWWKPLGFLILTLHWFNPLMWFGYVLLCRDIELACDEKVVKEFDNLQKADYSQALLTCSVNRSLIAACPIAFGEVGVKERVKSVLNYKKPAFWIVAAALTASITAAVCFLTNPINKSIFNSKFETGKCLYSDVISAEKETKINDVVLDITADGVVYKSFGENLSGTLGTLSQTDYTTEQLKETLDKQGEKIDLGKIKNAYSITNGDVIFQKFNGKVYWVLFASDGDVMNVFELKRLGDCEVAKGYSQAVSNAGVVELYEVTPLEDIQAKYDNEEFVYQKLHYKATDGTWYCEGYTYKYRLEITGRLKNAAKNTTYIVLSNSKDITFEQTWKASGLSSLMSDYFEPEDAVIVGHKLFS
ncbi:MAG: M56 family metallopeptidase [Acutalibacteraceae bacterium]